MYTIDLLQYTCETCASDHSECGHHSILYIQYSKLLVIIIIGWLTSNYGLLVVLVLHACSETCIQCILLCMDGDPLKYVIQPCIYTAPKVMIACMHCSYDK